MGLHTDDGFVGHVLGPETEDRRPGPTAVCHRSAILPPPSAVLLSNDETHRALGLRECADFVVHQAGGHAHIQIGRKIIEAPGACRPNHFVICELAKRLGAEHPGFGMTEMEIIDATLRGSGWPGATEVIEKRWLDVTPTSRLAAGDASLLAADGLHPSVAMYARWAADARPLAKAALGR